MHEVAQLYIHDKVASITQPVRALKGISHLDLQPGQSATVSFTLTPATISRFVHPDLKSYRRARRVRRLDRAFIGRRHVRPPSSYA